MVKVLVALTSYSGLIPIEVMRSVIGLRKPSHIYADISGTLCPDARNMMLSTALGNDCTHLFFVDDDNVAGPWSGNFDYPYPNIRDAVEDAGDGDTVHVNSGEYHELRVVIDRSINLIGENKITTIIEKGEGGNIIWVYTSNVKISSFTIKTTYISYSDIVAI